MAGCSSARRRPERRGADAQFADVSRLICGIASGGAEPDQVERLLDIVLDGLRYARTPRLSYRPR